MIQKLQTKQFKRLENNETKLKKKLKALYKSYFTNIDEIVASVYTGVEDYVDLTKKINKQQSLKLEKEVKKHKKKIPEEFKNEFPFNVKRFDKLSKYQYVKGRFVLNEIDTGYEEYEYIDEHLKDNVRACMHDINPDRKVTDNYIERKIINKPKYIEVVGGTILFMIIRNHIKEANQQSILLQQSILKHSSFSQTMSSIYSYTERTSTNNSNRIFFTEGTRTTHEADADEIDYDKYDLLETTDDEDEEEIENSYYYTVTAGDEQVCGICEEIAVQQQADPNILDDMVCGVNAPPFHPYCRCNIEIIDEEEYQKIVGGK